MIFEMYSYLGETPPMQTQLPYRPNVCIILVNQDNKFLLAEREGSPGHWQFAQGGMKVKGRDPTNDDITINGVRELEEELGVKPTDIQILAILTHVHQYDFDQPKPYGKSQTLYAGQRQNYLLVRYLGSDDSIVIPADSNELATYKWCTLEELYALAEPRRQKGYRPALAEALTHL